MAGKLALLGLALTGITLLALAAATTRHHSDRASPTPRRVATAMPAPPAGPTPAPPVSGRVAGLLPFDQTQLTDAAQVATRFTAAYASYRYDEPPDVFLARLRPMISTELGPSLTRAATDPTVINQRMRHHEIATAHARTDAIRDLGPTSITFLTSATSRITTDAAVRQETARYAVTLIPGAGSDGWRVYAIDLATLGDAGDAATGATQ